MQSKFVTLFLVVVTALTFSILPATESTLAAPAAKATINPQSMELNEKGAIAMQANDIDTAEKMFKRAYDIDPANLTAAFNLAGAYVANHKENEAISLLTNVTKTHKKDPGIYTRLGDAYFSNQNVNEARKAYESAFALDKNYPTLPMKLGAIYSMMQKLDDAEKMLSLAVEQDPQDAKSLANLAAVLLANNKPEDAIRAAKRSIQSKVDAEAYITLGQSYEALKDPSNAIISYEKAVALGKRDAEVLARIKELKEIKSKQG